MSDAGRGRKSNQHSGSVQRSEADAKRARLSSAATAQHGATSAGAGPSAPPQAQQAMRPDVWPSASRSAPTPGQRADDARQQLAAEVLSWHELMGTGPTAESAARSRLPDPPQSEQLSFKSVAAYQDFFRPLLLLELFEEISKGVHEGRNRDGGGLHARLRAAPRRVYTLPDRRWACWELQLALDNGASQLSTMDAVRIDAPRGRADLDAPPAEDGPPAAVHPLSRLPALALVWRRECERNSLVVHAALPHGAAPAGGGAPAAGGGHGKLRLSRLGSCTTTLREWQAAGCIDTR